MFNKDSEKILKEIAGGTKHPVCVRARVHRRPEALRMTSHSDTVLGLVPCHHVFGLLVNLCTSLLQGCTVVNVPDFDKMHLLRAMDHYHVRLGFRLYNSFLVSS